MKQTFLISVEVERDEGKFASRDEISEKIIEEIDSSIDMVDLSGLGADGNSVYSISDWDIKELDAKDLRQFYREYEEHVIQELPGDEELRKENQHLRSQLKALNDALDKVKTRNIELMEEQESRATRIYQRDILDRAKRTYFDEKHPITFQWGANDNSESVIVDYHQNEDGCMLEIRSQGWADLLVKPYSGNIIHVQVKERS